MLKKRKRNAGEAAKLEMTPMIDVVFQLLIFFIVTIKPEDILSRLNASRPQPDPDAKKEEQPELVTITIHPEGYLWGKGYPVTLKSLRRKLIQMATYSRTTTIIVKCTMDSHHGKLVKVLDACSEAKLENINVFSM